MKSTLVLFALFLSSPFAAARISTVQELRYLTEVLGPIAAEGGFTLIEDSISVHGFSAQEDAGTYRWWNTPSGNQDHTVIFKVRRGDEDQFVTVFFMSKESHLGRTCRLFNGTSRRMVSAFDGRENCVSLYLKPRRRAMGTTPTMETLRRPHTMLWNALGSKKP
jgi:hypothetical protein